jgi:hypothetical protein
VARILEALSAALQWRLLLLCTVVMLLPAAIVAMPLHGLLSALDWSPRAEELARHFDAIVFADLAASLGPGRQALRGALLLGTLVTLVSAPGLAALAVTAARRSRERLTAVTLLQGAAADYFRMARLLLVLLVPLAVAGALVTTAYSIADHVAEHAVRASRAHLAYWLASLAAIVIVGLVHASGEAARAHMAVDANLRSGWRAWLRGVALLAGRPVPVLLLFAIPTVVAAIAAALPLLVRIRIPASNGVLFCIGFVITQLAIAAIGWGRAARIFALTQLLRDADRDPVVRPGAN